MPKNHLKTGSKKNQKLFENKIWKKRKGFYLCTPKTKETKRQKILKNKFWKSKKGFYLCSPKTRERKSGKHDA